MANASKPDRPALVVGATGMLGRFLAAHLDKAGWKVAGVSRAVREEFSKINPSVVFNCAAWSDVDGCEREPERAREANALLVKFLAEACTAANAPLVHVSTDYVFSGRQKTPYSETAPTFPVNIYGLTKLEGEWHAASCAAGAAIVRTSWLFGGASAPNFVHTITARLRKEKEVAVLDDQTDCPTSVKDLSIALEKIAGRLLSGKAGGPAPVYHVCNSGPTTRYEMTRRIAEWLALPAAVKVADRSMIKNRIAVRPIHSVMSCARFEGDFGVKLRPWQDALREYVTDPVACAS